MSKNKEFDIYELILNKEIREYFKKNRKFTISEQIQIILHSYAPVGDKLKNLYRLTEAVGEMERKKVVEFAKAMEYCKEQSNSMQDNLELEVESKWIDGKQEIAGFYPEQYNGP